jgi:hypothetical protein
MESGSRASCEERTEHVVVHGHKRTLGSIDTLSVSSNPSGLSSISRFADRSGFR